MSRYNVKELKKRAGTKNIKKKTCPCSPNVKTNYAANIRQKTSIDDKSQKKYQIVEIFRPTHFKAI